MCRTGFIPEIKKQKICELCGSIFTAYRSNAKYCGIKCSSHKHKEMVRLKKENGYLSPYEIDRFVILNRDNFRCIYCGKTSIEDNKELHIDHIDPKSKGGEDIASNLITSCKDCNRSKWDKPLSVDTVNRVKAVAMQRNIDRGIDQNQRISH